MVDSVIRNIKLPDGRMAQVKVPSDWTPDQLKSELINRGVIKSPTESQSFFLSDVRDSLADIPGAITHGAQKGLGNVFQTLADLGTEFDKAYPGLAKFSPTKLEQGIADYIKSSDVGHEPFTTAGKFAEVIGQAGAGAAASPIKGLGLLKTMSQIGIGDFLAFDPEETKTLSTALNDVPYINKIIWDGLVSDDNDTEWEGKLKLAGEGVLAGGILHKLIGAVKEGKDAIKARLVKPVPAEEVKPTLALPAPQREIHVNSQGEASIAAAPNTSRNEGRVAQSANREERLANARNEADAQKAAEANRIAEQQAHTERQAAFDTVQAEAAAKKRAEIESTYTERDAARKFENEQNHIEDLRNRVAINPENKLKFGGKQSGQINPQVFREGVKKIYQGARNFGEFLTEGRATYGSGFADVAEALYRSIRAEAGDIPQQSASRPRQGGYNPNKMNAPEEIKQYTDELIGKFGKSKEVKSWAEVKAKAANIGMNKEQVKRLRSESENWTARVKAAEAASIDSWTTTQQHAIKAVDGSVEDLTTFYRKMVEDSELLNNIVGIRSESGRLLNSLKMMSDSRGEASELFRKHMEKGGGLESLRSIAQKVAEAETPAAGRKISSRAIRKPTLLDAVLEYWMNWGLLSGPQTHITNFGSNGIFHALISAENYGAVAVGRVLNSSDRMTLKQANRYTAAYGQAGLDAVKSLRKTLTSDDAIIVAGNREIRDAQGKIELDAHRAWSSNTFSRYIPSFMTKHMSRETRDTIAKYHDIASEYGIRAPGKALYAADAFWKTFAYRAKLNQLAMDETEKLLKAGKIKEGDAAATYQGIVNDPPKALHEAAMESSRYSTFTNELGQTGKLFQAILSNEPYLKFAVPFVRTVFNIFKRSMERTPLGLITLRKQLAAGGRARDEALSKILLGTSVGTIAWNMAAGGNMTSFAPKDPIAKSNFYESGRIPNAIRVGDEWVSIARLGPVADVMAAAATAHDLFDYMTEEEREDTAGSLTAAVGNVLINKTYMESVASIVQAVDEPDRYGAKWLQNTLASLAVPNLAAQIARDIDPHIKQINSISDAVKQRIPGYRGEVVNRLNRWGEPLEMGGNMLNPMWDSKATDSKFLQAMYKNHIRVGMPDKEIDGITLSPRLYNQYVQLGRIPARRQLEAMYNNGTLAKASPEIQERIIKKVVSQWDNYAKQRMEALPEIMQLKIQKQIDEAKALGTPEREFKRYKAE